MSLSDRLSASPAGEPARRGPNSHPKGFEPGVRYDADLPAEVTLQLTTVPETEAEWREQIKAKTGLDIPPERRVQLTGVRYWNMGSIECHYARFSIVDREAEGNRLDMDEIIARVEREIPHRPAPIVGGRALVVCWADLQVGKVDVRGGTDELIDRVLTKLAKLEDYAERYLCDSAYLFDLGDCVEGFENTPGQAFTNDLSLPEQLRVSRRLTTEAITRLARSHDRVVAATVPSNHAQWRRGKGKLGKPTDDFGIEIMTSIADAFELNPAAYGHVSFVVPQPWEETISLDVEGTVIGAAHGHQVNRPERVPDWWAKQAHGGQPVADADILLTGHFHHARILATGRNPHTNRGKWWIQAPTLDNGSSWYRHQGGDDSDPALMVFTVESGRSWDHLELL